MTSSPKDMLSGTANSYRNKIHVISLVQEIIVNDQVFLFGVRYVPDKILLAQEGVCDYLTQTLGMEARGIEQLTHDILEDVMDHIIPKWIEVTLKQKQNKAGQEVVVIMEDRQPGWENEPLLKRLPALF